MSCGIPAGRGAAFFLAQGAPKKTDLVWSCLPRRAKLAYGGTGHKGQGAGRKESKRRAHRNWEIGGMLDWFYPWLIEQERPGGFCLECALRTT